ncbi:hypothetical protein COB55_02390 [Candidatus Wolfebacteria bacterium]|nr:MAG: hypothetical protein COB55_02390 [Candidatus Wolfebacteria bacterium]
MSTGRTKLVVSPEYVVGLTDGEGCFYVNVSTSSAYHAGAFVQLHFHVKLNELDKGVLDKVKTTLDCGNVYFQKEQRANHAQCYRYTVSARNDIFQKIIPFFEKYPLQTATKRNSFKVFCQIANLVKQDQHLKKSGIEKIRKLKSGMNKKTTGFA